VFFEPLKEVIFMKYKWSLAFFLLGTCSMTFAEESITPVLPEHITKWTGNPYPGSIDVSITHEAGILKAKLETDDLILTSLSLANLDDYIQLFEDPIAMEKYADGMPWTRDEIEMAVQDWAQRWEVFQDPFSAFAIFLKQSDNPLFIGHLVLDHSSRYSQSELAFLLRPQYSNIDFAVQAVTAVLDGYVPAIVDQYLVNLNETGATPSILKTIHSTAHIDDTFSGQAMIRSGMKIGTEELFENILRFNYLITVDQILTKVQLEEEFLIEGAD
jgi:RimJ/RimL family protein N-acetyltransferase